MHDFAAFLAILELKKDFKALMDQFIQRISLRLAEADEVYLCIVKMETSLVDILYHVFHLNRLLAKQWKKDHEAL